MTLGEKRVRTKFNPSADSFVDQIKQQSAKLIDMCAPDTSDEETQRLWELAAIGYEQAAMWAVKAATSSK